MSVNLTQLTDSNQKQKQTSNSIYFQNSSGLNPKKSAEIDAFNPLDIKTLSQQRDRKRDVFGTFFISLIDEPCSF